MPMAAAAEGAGVPLAAVAFPTDAPDYATTAKRKKAYYESRE